MERRNFLVACAQKLRSVFPLDARLVHLSPQSRAEKDLELCSRLLQGRHCTTVAHVQSRQAWKRAEVMASYLPLSTTPESSLHLKRGLRFIYF
jgi:hypothetical protein